MHNLLEILIFTLRNFIKLPIWRYSDICNVLHRHAQLYLKDRKIPWVIHGIDLSQGSHGLYMGLN